MPEWMIVTALIMSTSLSFGAGIIVATIGVVTKEKKAVKRGTIDIDGEFYLLTKLTKER